MWLFDPAGFTVGDIYQVVQRSKTKPKKRKRSLSASVDAAASSSSATEKKSRRVTWSPGNKYICIKTPTTTSQQQEVEVAFKNKTLSEAHFYIFKNVDPHVERNEEIPAYEAVYKWSEAFIKAQKCQLKQAYLNDGRVDSKRIWEIMADGTPYHVDRFAFCKQRQINSKKK